MQKNPKSKTNFRYEIQVFKSDGSSDGEKDIKDFPVLDDGKGVDALRQAIIAVHANQRQGNASTKVRSEVAGSGKKIYRQKGLGVGRAGDKKAIQRRGGGVILDQDLDHTIKK